MKIYTRTGDDGTTGLRTGDRVSKADPRIRANGAIDEANAMLGVVLASNVELYESRSAELFFSTISRLQNDLFTLGSDISNTDMNDTNVRVTKSMITYLESIIDSIESDLPPLTNFILPGGGMAGALLHVTRAIVRRAESHMAQIPEPINPECFRYINRLSDLLFVLARQVNHSINEKESIWRP